MCKFLRHTFTHFMCPAYSWVFWCLLFFSRVAKASVGRHCDSLEKSCQSHLLYLSVLSFCVSWVLQPEIPTLHLNVLGCDAVAALPKTQATHPCQLLVKTDLSYPFITTGLLQLTVLKGLPILASAPFPAGNASTRLNDCSLRKSLCSMPYPLIYHYMTWVWIVRLFPPEVAPWHQQRFCRLNFTWPLLYHKHAQTTCPPSLGTMHLRLCTSFHTIRTSLRTPSFCTNLFTLSPRKAARRRGEQGRITKF